MYRILLAADENEERTEAQTRAVRRLSENNTTLAVTLIHVFNAESGNRFTENAPLREQLPENVAALQMQLEKMGYETDVVIETSNNIGNALVQTAGEIGADCIIVGGRKRSPVGKALFGSVAQHTILNADIPVMIAQ